MRTLGVIPARGGSKRVPGKNLRKLLGKPLIDFTLEAASHAKKITKSVLTSDSDEILDHASLYGIKALKRPFYLAGDMVTSGAVVRHALDSFAEAFDMVVLLHPTSPIRHPAHIDQAIDLLWASSLDYLASVNPEGNYNASIYCMKVPAFKLTNSHKVAPYVPFPMDEFHSVDINEEADLITAEIYLTHGQRI